MKYRWYFDKDGDCFSRTGGWGWHCSGNEGDDRLQNGENWESVFMWAWYYYINKIKNIQRPKLPEGEPDGR